MTFGVDLFAFHAGPLDLPVRRFCFFEIGNRRPGRVRYGTLSTRAEECSGRRTRVEVGAGLVLVSGPTTCPGFLDRRGLLVLAADDGTIPAGLG